MTRLEEILKMFGQAEVSDCDGKTVVWVWGYAKDQARIKSEMTKAELAESEKAKYKSLINKNNTQ